jgi:hypothetical protein
MGVWEASWELRENIVNLENRKTGKKMAGNRFECFRE